MQEKKDIFNHFQLKSIQTPEADYFESLANKIIIDNSSEARVIPIYKKPVFWIASTAAAAIVLLFLPFGRGSQFNIAEELDKIPDAEVKEYVQLHSDEFDEDILFQSVDFNDPLNHELINELIFDRTQDMIPTSTTLDLKEINSTEIQEFLYDQGYETEDLDVVFI